MNILELFDPRLPPRFWSKVITEPNTGCWLWLGAVLNPNSSRKNKYGIFNVGNRKARLVHRVAMAAIEPLVDGLEVDHRCLTTLCVNPRHLQQVTPARNQALGRERRTRCKRGHELTEDNVWESIVGSGYSHRQCIACWNIARLKRGK